MQKQLEQLRSETHKAESEFQEAVKYYLLNPLETPEKFRQTLVALFESVTKYRIILNNLRNCLNAMDGSESFLMKQATIKRALVSLNTRDAALERLLKKISRLALDHDPPKQNLNVR